MNFKGPLPLSKKIFKQEKEICKGQNYLRKKLKFKKIMLICEILLQLIVIRFYFIIRANLDDYRLNPSNCSTLVVV